jgi:dipeptidyl aminopeptidase/acylaminoacyl peptidase
VYDRKSGHILFVRQGTLLAQMFDVGKLAVTGEPFPVAEGVEASAVPGLAAFAVSDTGVLVYGLGDPAGVGLQLTWVDRTGKALGTVGAVAPYRGFNLSPDDSQVVAHTHEGDGGDVWLMDVARGTTARFTFDASQENASPIWSPDGRRIAFSSVRNGNPGIYVKPANNSGAEQQVLEVPGARTVLPLSWSPDGGSILFQMPGVQTSSDVWTLPLSGKPKPVALLQGPFAEGHGQISPDGRWLAYQSNETGVLQIYVRPVSGTGGKWPVSTVSGTTPRWRADSRELFYISGGKLWAVDVTTKGDVFDAGSPKLLFEYSGIGNFASHPAYFPYAVAKDGQRLLVPRGPTGPDAVPHSSPIVVILNWLEVAKK